MPPRSTGSTPKADAEAPIEQRIESAEQFFSRINARVIHQGNRAYYSPDNDNITLPPFASFFAAVVYYSTRAHESAHSAASRIMPHRLRFARESLGKRLGVRHKFETSPGTTCTDKALCVKVNCFQILSSVKNPENLGGIC
jgi:antirestriction protein ArdC